MKDFFKALHGNFSILITKKDGNFSDETAHYRTHYPCKEALEGLKKMREIAKRTDIAFESISSEDELYFVNGEYKTCTYILIGLKEV